MIAEYVSKHFKRQRVHLVGHSFVGIDCRASVSLMGLGAERVSSVTTICSPNLGCRLIDMGMKFPESTEMFRMERAFEMLGMSWENVQEFNTKNMTNFNEGVEDVEGVGYYSFGSKKKELHMNELLRPGY